MQKITYAIIGYGGRGDLFAGLLRSPEVFGQVVAVAEPDSVKRNRAAQDWNLPPEKLFNSAAELFAQPKLADAVINTTMDQMHAEVAIQAMKMGYHQLLEKPMATTLADCLAIERAQQATRTIVAVCHSLRYHLVYANIKKMIDTDAVGQVINFDHIEGVGDVHYTSSYVRGNWARSSTSSFMLMTKSCHDLDLFNYVLSAKCQRVASFGSLSYFTGKNTPAGAPVHCLAGCPEQDRCPYHCGKIYLQDQFWRNYIFPNHSDEEVVASLRTGPYGKCVFQADNDVVDHQVVALEYENAITGTFTMTAFHSGGRFTRIHGTKGMIEADLDGLTIKHTDFVSGNINDIRVPTVPGGHGGGDYLVINDLNKAIRQGSPEDVLTTVQQSLASHAVVFAAEQARRESRVIEMSEFYKTAML